MASINGQKVNNAMLPNLTPYKQGGVDPKTLQPTRMVNGAGLALKELIRRQIRIQDEQDAINRFQWYNLPEGLLSKDIERMLYYKGNLIFFYLEPVDQFYIMPYALDGEIDYYGRYVTVHPIPFAEGTTKEEKAKIEPLRNYLATLKLKVLYDVKLDQVTMEDLKGSCVILRDYTNQLSQTNVPRRELNDCICDLEADCFPYMRTALRNSTGIQGIQVNNEDESSNVEAANETLERAALEGRRFVPVMGMNKYQDLSTGTVGHAQDFLIAMQALDNFRLGTYGIDNGGLFEKKAYQNVGETQLNGGTVKSPLQDSLECRQDFCNIVNSLTGLGIWCDLKDSAIGVDKDMDGDTAEDQYDTKSYASEGDNGNDDVQ